MSPKALVAKRVAAINTIERVLGIPLNAIKMRDKDLQVLRQFEAIAAHLESFTPPPNPLPASEEEVTPNDDNGRVENVEVQKLEEEASPEDKSENEISSIPKLENYNALKRDDLVEIAQLRGIYDSIQGSGSEGAILKDDLVKALEANDASV